MDLLPNLLTWCVLAYPGVREKCACYRSLGQFDDGVNSSISHNFVEASLSAQEAECAHSPSDAHRVGDAAAAPAVHPEHVSHNTFVNLTFFFFLQFV